MLLKQASLKKRVTGYARLHVQRCETQLRSLANLDNKRSAVEHMFWESCASEHVREDCSGMHVQV